MSYNDFIIPAIDLIDGKVVRLTQGDFSQQTPYSNNPLEVAKRFEDAGLNRLHLVDLDGARAGKIRNLAVLEKIAAGTKLSIDFGGGIKTASDIRSVLDAGAGLITIGSLAVKDPALFSELVREFTPSKFFIGADVLNEQIKINGWVDDAGISIKDFIIRMQSLGLNNFFCTDISLDGAMKGTSISLYKDLTTTFPTIQLTASGGVASLEDVRQARAAGCHAVIIGKAIYEGVLSLQDLSRLNANPDAL